MMPQRECYLKGKPNRAGKYVDCKPIDSEEDYCYGCKVFVCEAHVGEGLGTEPIGPHQPLDHVLPQGEKQ